MNRSKIDQNDSFSTIFCRDFDPAETMQEKLTKFSDVKGIWGVKKLAKELLQTVSTGKHDNELIGSAQITLKVKFHAVNRVSADKLFFKLSFRLQRSYLLFIRFHFSKTYFFSRRIFRLPDKWLGSSYKRKVKKTVRAWFYWKCYSVPKKTNE